MTTLAGAVSFAWTEDPSLEGTDKTRLDTYAVWGPADKQDDTGICREVRERRQLNAADERPP